VTEQRRLAAIVSADVAGYSRLMGHDECGTLAALKVLRQEVVDPTISSRGGRIVKTTGDGLLLEFPSVVNAVRCAVALQTAMADRSAEIAEDRRIAFRIGINLGDIILMAKTSLATVSTSLPACRRSRRLAVFAYRAACMRMYAIVSIRCSTTAACRRSRTSRGLFKSGCGSPM
jgi:hypothetical protein